MRPIPAILATLLAVVVVVFVAARLLDRPAWPDYARVVDDRTLAIGTVTGPATWTRITSVVETDAAITVALSSLTAPLPGSGSDMVELTVHLQDPIGSRSVIDGNTGNVVPVTTCPPPAYLEPGCLVNGGG